MLMRMIINMFNEAGLVLHLKTGIIRQSCYSVK